MKPLRIYFDFISPFAYIAWKKLPELAARHGRSVEPVPVLFAAFLNEHGHKGPAEIAPKREYVFKNVVRLAHGANLPLTPPPGHPFNPLLALRIASLDRPPEETCRAIDALYDAVWGGGPGVTDPSTVSALLTAADLDGDALVAEATTPRAKLAVRNQTGAAIEAGVFGVPTIDADGEFFWGYDAFPHIEQFLRGEDPVNDELLQRWEQLPAQAKRPGS